MLETYLAINLPSSRVDITKVITQLVVAWVIPSTLSAAKHSLLFASLDAFSACSNAAAGDSVSNETIVVTSAIKGDESVVEALLLIPVDVQLLQIARPSWVDFVAGIIDLVCIVGTRHHVVVHEQSDLLVLLLAEALDVED